MTCNGFLKRSWVRVPSIPTNIFFPFVLLYSSVSLTNSQKAYTIEDRVGMASIIGCFILLFFWAASKEYNTVLEQEAQTKQMVACAQPGLSPDQIKVCQNMVYTKCLDDAGGYSSHMDACKEIK